MPTSLVIPNICSTLFSHFFSYVHPRVPTHVSVRANPLSKKVFDVVELAVAGNGPEQPRIERPRAHEGHFVGAGPTPIPTNLTGACTPILTSICMLTWQKKDSGNMDTPSLCAPFLSKFIAFVFSLALLSWNQIQISQASDPAAFAALLKRNDVDYDPNYRRGS